MFGCERRQPKGITRISYFERFGFCERQIRTVPAADLGLVVVIPCFNEPDLIGSLESLRSCDPPACAVEVIVVINSPANTSEEVELQNQTTLREATVWVSQASPTSVSFHLLHMPELPAKQAGVGLARKIGMDEATRRFDDVGNAAGIIVCFDADCRCERNYLISIKGHFQKYPRTPGCSIYFEHPLSGVPGSRVDEAISAYELHLRYYVQALRYAGFPYAHHTIGSCMAVRADIYKRQGGMNKRQAGEDFYFLQKIIPLGGFTDLTATTVSPSPRASNRVPFGTGKAVGDCLAGQPGSTYPLQAFLDLKLFFDYLPGLLASPDFRRVELPDFLPESIWAFLKPEVFGKVMAEIHENTASSSAFQKRFFQWFSGFQTMKFIHHARDQFYGPKLVAEEAQGLLRLQGKDLPKDTSIGKLLRIYRDIDRNGSGPWSGRPITFARPFEGGSS